MIMKCPRCIRGQLLPQHITHGQQWNCLQCGYTAEIKKEVEWAYMNLGVKNMEDLRLNSP